MSWKQLIFRRKKLSSRHTHNRIIEIDCQNFHNFHKGPQVLGVTSLMAHESKLDWDSSKRQNCTNSEKERKPKSFWQESLTVRKMNVR